MRLMWMIGLALVMGCSTDNVLSPEDQMKKDLKAIDRYLDDNGIVAVEDVSGLRIVVLEAGSGVPPGIDANVTVSYTGRFLDGRVFAPTDTQTYPLANLIEGWKIAIAKYIGKGGKATLYIPSGLGYGRAGKGSIPGNANLIFDMEFLGYTQ